MLADLPPDVHWKEVYAAVPRQLESIIKGPGPLKNGWDSALRRSCSWSQGVTGCWVGADGIFHNDCSVGEVVSDIPDVDHWPLPRAGDVLMNVKVIGDFDSVSLVSCSFLGEPLDPWGQASPGEDMAHGVPLLQLGTPLYLTFQGRRSNLTAVITYSYLPPKSRRAIIRYRNPYSTEGDIGITVRLEGGGLASVYGVQEHGYTPNRLYRI